MSTLTLKSRDPKVKARGLRRAGFIPCCIYGPQLPESLSAQLEESIAERLLREKGIGSKMEVELNGQKIWVLLKEVTHNTLKNTIEHIDLQALDANTRVNSTAKVILTNRDKVLGMTEQVLFKIPYIALPADIFESVTIDLSGLKIGNRITLKDVDIPQNVELLIDADSLILTVSDNKRA
ncbi:50S ribosomal protein L25 [Sporanaerobium hydrogeniformans]|uniref:50S ribosomal protein L25 n=1 Tax=Sporanaerobium hydrogeniformans TaxID=3072179 RepID=A0AC61DJC0_9FIRM|nr:50S ribosomal protein L25 [Sporanaerobium hydrogeniformans]PHV72262.1 50S ribosomal protein L25 [Sporanaerobium hydrogeniformans]